MNVEPKILLAETEAYLCSLPWPGNVRQLENTCRWVTVMGSGREVHISDLPPEMLAHDNTQETLISGGWENHLQNWAETSLTNGKTNILQVAVPIFEETLIKVALQHTRGRKRDAAELLGWGRNTLTRKIKELELVHDHRGDH